MHGREERMLPRCIGIIGALTGEVCHSPVPGLIKRGEFMALKPITVSQLNRYIGKILSTDPILGNVSVQGEISNLKYHGSGHVYFP